MADLVKDFVYYADKAEHHLKQPSMTLDAAKLNIARAEMYTRLAAAAPGVIMCDALKRGEIAFERLYRCSLRAAHDGEHRTDDGVNFAV